jgi:hypothetical protein
VHKYAPMLSNPRLYQQPLHYYHRSLLSPTQLEQGLSNRPHCLHPVCHFFTLILGSKSMK